jgi:hypothetical protein
MVMDLPPIGYSPFCHLAMLIEHKDTSRGRPYSFECKLQYALQQLTQVELFGELSADRV